MPMFFPNINLTERTEKNNIIACCLNRTNNKIHEKYMNLQITKDILESCKSDKRQYYFNKHCSIFRFCVRISSHKEERKRSKR